MAVILNNGYVFYHIPKTAGTWFRKELYRLNLFGKEVGRTGPGTVQSPGKDRERNSQKIQL